LSRPSRQAGGSGSSLWKRRRASSPAAVADLPVVAAGAGSGMPGENIRTWVKDVPEKFLKLFLRLSTKPCG
jgi:hypothetical protein